MITCRFLKRCGKIVVRNRDAAQINARSADLLESASICSTLLPHRKACAKSFSISIFKDKA